MKKIILFALLFLPMNVHAKSDSPVLVELFTSQGCSSCPPADELLGKLANEEDVSALSFHVDYWDQLGWKDPYSLAESTARQRDYSLRGWRMYTPQMIFNGDKVVPGTAEEKVYDAIDEQKNIKNPVSIKFKKKGKKLEVELIPAEGMRQKNVSIWIVRYEPETKTRITSGENDGDLSNNYNVVRKLGQLAVWNSEPKTFEIDEGKFNTAIIVQEKGAGRVLGSAIYEVIR